MRLRYFRIEFALFLLWFVLIFGPILDVGLGPLADTSVAIAAVLSVRMAWVGIRQLDAYMVACLMGVFVLACVTFILLDQGAHTVAFRAIIRPIRALIVYFGVVALSHYTVRILHRSDMSEMDVVLKGLFIIYLTVVLHALIMAGQFLSPSFRNSIYSLTFAKYQFEFYQTFRMAGLSGAGGAQVSAVQGLGALIGVYLFMRRYALMTIILTFPVLLLSVFLSGRTGLLVIFLSFMFGLQIFLFVGMKKIRVKDATKVIAGLLLLVFFVLQFAAFLTASDYYEVVFNRTFDTILRYSETGTLQDNTIDALAQMIVLPDSIIHLMFGQASYIENNTYYDINTDIGYFRLIWAYGLVGLIFHFLFYLGFVRLSIKNSAIDVSYAYFSLAMILTIFVLNTKEIFFLTSMSFPLMSGCILLGRYMLKSRNV